MTRAHENFLKHFPETKEPNQLPRPCSYKIFYDQVHKHYLAYLRGDMLEDAPRGSITGLSPQELQELVELLVTPAVDDCSYKLCHSLTEAAEKSPRISELLNKATVSRQFLHKHLVDNKLVRWIQEDTAEKLVERTLKQHIKAADIWAGREPWLEKLSPKFMRTHGETDQWNTAAYSKALLEAEKGLISIYFRPEYFKHFGFQIDACSFHTKVDAKDTKARVYAPVDRVYPPKLVKGRKKKAKLMKVMMYVAIQRKGGIIQGPDMMYSGSSVCRKDGEKSWCVCLTCYMVVYVQVLMSDGLQG